MALGEDHCRVKTGTAPHTLAVFRNAGLSLLRFLGCHEITKTLRLHACRVDLLLAKLGIPKL